jgi:outer membrane protein
MRKKDTATNLEAARSSYGFALLSRLRPSRLALRAGLRFARACVSRMHIKILLCLMCFFVATPQLSAQTAPALDLDLLSRGRPTFPLVWQNFRQMPLPPVNPNNGPMVSAYIKQGKLALSLSEFMRLVLENNLTLRAARYNYLIAQVDLQRARSGQAARGVPGVPVPGAFFAGAIGAGIGNIQNVTNQGTGGTSISGATRAVFISPRGVADPTFTINMSWDHVVNPLNSTRVAGVSTVTIPSTVLQTRFQQQLPFGTGYSIDFNLQRQSTTQAHILYSPAYTSYFGLQVYQPLLNGFGRAYTRRFVNLAENDLQSAYLSVAVARDGVLSDARTAYWDLVAFRDRQKVAERTLALNETIYRSTQQRIEFGVQAATDLLTAAAQVAASRRDLIIARTNVQLQEVQVKSFMTKTLGAEIAAIPFEPTDTLEGTMDTPMPTLEEALKTAMSKPPVRQAQYSLKSNEIAEAFTRSNLRPTLSILGEFSSHSLAPGLGGMFGQALRYDYSEFAVGLTLNFSVKNRTAQADNLRAHLELERAKVTLEEAKANSVLNIRTSVTNLTPSRAQVVAAQQARVASQETADAEQEKWNIGVSTLDQVYQTQVDLVRAQLAEIQARVNYAKTLMAAESAAGTFLPLYGFDPADGISGNLWKNPPAK